MIAYDFQIGDYAFLEEHSELYQVVSIDRYPDEDDYMTVFARCLIHRPSMRGIRYRLPKDHAYGFNPNELIKITEQEAFHILLTKEQS